MITACSIRTRPTISGLEGGKALADICREYRSWAAIHDLPEGILSLEEFSQVINRYQRADNSFRTAIFRGEASIFDEVNTGHDTYLIPKITRNSVIRDRPLTSYSRHVSRRFERLNLSIEEIEEIDRFQNEHPVEGLPRSSAVWVALAQHYGAMTRLLDFTSYALVGLFFACWEPSMADPWEPNDGVVYMLLPNTMRSQSMNREYVTPGDIEQGRPSSIYELFEPWALSDVTAHIAYRYNPPDIDLLVNERLRAQSGLFVWWHPPNEQMSCQKFPVIIQAQAKRDILRTLAPLGFRPEVLFPDNEGKEYQAIFEEVIMAN